MAALRESRSRVKSSILCCHSETDAAASPVRWECDSSNCCNCAWPSCTVSNTTFCSRALEMTGMSYQHRRHATRITVRDPLQITLPVALRTRCRPTASNFQQRALCGRRNCDVRRNRKLEHKQYEHKQYEQVFRNQFQRSKP